MTPDDMGLLTAVLRDVFEDPTLEVHPGLHADDVEAWDSFSHVTLVVELEQRFGVEFDGDELAALTDVAAIVAAIDRRRGVA